MLWGNHCNRGIIFVVVQIIHLIGSASEDVKHHDGLKKGSKLGTVVTSKDYMLR